MSTEEPGPKTAFLVPQVKSRRLISHLFFIMNSRVHCRLTLAFTVHKLTATPLQDCEQLNDVSENALSAPGNANPGRESRAHLKGNDPILWMYLIQRILYTWRFLGLALLIPHEVRMISPWLSFWVMLVEQRVKAASHVYGLLQLRAEMVFLAEYSSGLCFHVAAFVLCSLKYLSTENASVSSSQIKRHMQISCRLCFIETKPKPNKIHKNKPFRRVPWVRGWGVCKAPQP